MCVQSVKWYEYNTWCHWDFWILLHRLVGKRAEWRGTGEAVGDGDFWILLHQLAGRKAEWRETGEAVGDGAVLRRLLCELFLLGSGHSGELVVLVFVTITKLDLSQCPHSHSHSHIDHVTYWLKCSQKLCIHNYFKYEVSQNPATSGMLFPVLLL